MSAPVDDPFLQGISRAALFEVRIGSLDLPTGTMASRTLDPETGLKLLTVFLYNSFKNRIPVRVGYAQADGRLSENTTVTPAVIWKNDRLIRCSPKSG